MERNENVKFALCTTYGVQRHIPADATPVENGDMFPYYSIEVNTIEDVLRLADITTDGIVIFKSQAKYEADIAPYVIEIYDGYRE